MAKNFAPRVSKKDRQVISFDENLDIKSVLKTSDDKLLRGAKLDEILLKDIVVKEQVRTKFNDKSLQDLAENIKVNGLIQPLVVHRVGNKYTLICGERRFRAMNLISLDKAPCFVLENKSDEELMAIQFSENSSREQLHWIDQAQGILNYQLATQSSERKIMDALGISKSEVHRGLIIAKMPESIKQAAKIHDIEKYVLLEWNLIDEGKEKEDILQEIIAGKITKRSELKKSMGKSPKSQTFTKAQAVALLNGLKKNGDQVLDERSQKALALLLEDSPLAAEFQ